MVGKESKRIIKNKAETNLQILIIYLFFAIVFFYPSVSYPSYDGTPVVGSDFENVVAILEDGELICSGTLISDDVIYTAGHCILDEQPFAHKGRNLNQLLSDLGSEYHRKISDFVPYIQSLPTREEKRIELNRYLEAIIEYRKYKLRIYFGSGKPRGYLFGEDIVDEVVLDEDWVDLLRYRLFKTFGVLKEDETKTGEQEINDSIKTADFGEIHLVEERKVGEINILRPFTKKEYQAIKFTGKEVVKLVGYGYTSIAREFRGMGYRNTYGVKNQLDVFVNGSLYNGDEEFKVVGSYRKGASARDSGGGAFIRMNDGTWRFLGIIIGSSPFPGELWRFNIDGRTVTGTSLIYIKTLD